MDRKSKYRDFCNGEESLPIFHRDWWLDAACGHDGWDVAIAVSGGNIVGVLPYSRVKRYSFTILTQPPLTPRLGPWLNIDPAKPAKLLARQKDIMSELIEQLPNYALFHQCFGDHITNWLPFKWKGFAQTTAYSYLLENIGDPERLWGGLQENIRREIRKAKGRFGLTVQECTDITEFLDLARRTFVRQNLKFPVSEAIFRRIDLACDTRNCRKIWLAKDAAGTAHAGAYIVWDRGRAYYLFGGSDPGLRNSGAGSLCLWHAINAAAEVTATFDFEGSVIEAIERFFRAFGARQVPYFVVARARTALLRFYMTMVARKPA